MNNSELLALTLSLPALYLIRGRNASPPSETKSALQLYSNCQCRQIIAEFMSVMLEYWCSVYLGIGWVCMTQSNRTAFNIKLPACIVKICPRWRRLTVPVQQVIKDLSSLSRFVQITTGTDIQSSTALQCCTVWTWLFLLKYFSSTSRSDRITCYYMVKYFALSK